MNIYEHIFLGFLQGFTEFLPISSSGHLFLAQEFFGFVPDISLEIWLHGASLLAVILFFWKRILQIFSGIFSLNADGVLAGQLLLSTLITAGVGVPLHTYFETDLSLQFVGITLLCTAFFILVSERFRPQKPKKFSWTKAILLGVVQAIAVLPGISRSGITIAFLILTGVERKRSAEISFLLSIPTILGALVYASAEKSQEFFSSELFWGIGAGFVASLLAIKWMMKLVEGAWIWFALYCCIAGGVLFFFF